MMTNRSLAIGVGGLLTAGMIGWGGISAVSLTSGVERETTTYDHWAMPSGGTLAVDTNAGDITISRSHDDQVRMTAHKEAVFAMPKVEIDRDDSAISIHTSCPVLDWWAECHVSFDIAVPDGIAIDAVTQSGDLRASDLQAPVLAVQSTSGDVDVSGLVVEGTLSARATSGDVNIEDVSAKVLDLGTTSGDVEALRLSATSSANLKVTSGDVNGDFEQPPARIDAQATSGDVTVSVPHDEEFRVTTDVTSGDEHPEVRNDPTATQSIDARATSGDVTVEYR